MVLKNLETFLQTLHFIKKAPKFVTSFSGFSEMVGLWKHLQLFINPDRNLQANFKKGFVLPLKTKMVGISISAE